MSKWYGAVLTLSLIMVDYIAINNRAIMIYEKHNAYVAH